MSCSLFPLLVITVVTVVAVVVRRTVARLAAVLRAAVRLARRLAGVPRGRSDQIVAGVTVRLGFLVVGLAGLRRLRGCLGSGSGGFSGGFGGGFGGGGGGRGLDSVGGSGGGRSRLLGPRFGRRLVLARLVLVIGLLAPSDFFLRGRS